MPIDQFTSRLEPLLKVGAASVAVMYGMGYVIVSVHHATFGIAQFDPFRPKIVLTGLIFTVLTVVPIIAAFRTLGLAGLSSTTGIGIPAQPENRGYLRAVLCIDFYALCWLLARYSGFLFGGFSDTKPWGNTLLFASLISYVVLGLVMRKHFDKSPWIFIALASVVTASLFTEALFFEDRKLFGMSLWFCGVGLFSVMMFSLVKDPNSGTTFEWERDFALVAAVILIYSTLIYKNIVPHFGGGLPAAATFYFYSDNQFSSARKANVLLVEETQNGYYVIKGEKDRNAYFLPRGLVSMVHFGKTETETTPSGSPPAARPSSSNQQTSPPVSRPTDSSKAATSP